MTSLFLLCSKNHRMLQSSPLGSEMRHLAHNLLSKWVQIPHLFTIEPLQKADLHFQRILWEKKSTEFQQHLKHFPNTHSGEKKITQTHFQFKHYNHFLAADYL